jgi:hypothetical protein
MTVQSTHVVPPQGTHAAGPAPVGIDSRGPQFAAAITSVVVIAALLAPPPVALAIISVQAALFALGAVRGVQHTPHAGLFRTAIRPRLAPATEFEDAAPPRFAQAVGLVFALVAVLGFVLGATVVAQVALGMCLVAALLNAVFRFCLGCEMYLLLKRITG